MINYVVKCITSKNVFYLVLVLIALGLVEFGTIPHLQSIGFSCGDPKISYKYKGDTVEPHVLILVTLIIPYLTVSHNN